MTFSNNTYYHVMISKKYYIVPQFSFSGNEFKIIKIAHWLLALFIYSFLNASFAHVY